MKLRRHPLLSVVSLSALALSTLGAACGQAPVEGEVIDPGVAARVVRESVGGIASLRVRTELDSTSKSWKVITCPMSLEGAACESKGHVTTGFASPASILALYNIGRSDAFRALKSHYRATGQVADGMSHTLTISAEGRTRTLQWEDGASLPTALSDFSTALYTATNGSMEK